MFSKLLKKIKELLSVSVPEKYKKEFETGVNSINISRGKTTAVVFIAVEALILSVSLLAEKQPFLPSNNVYYCIMYIVMIMTMAFFLLVFIKFGRNIPGYGTGIRIAGILFAYFILLWCAGISLLDQLSSGQIIIYVAAIMAVAMTPLYEPVVLLIIYLTVHIFFIALLPYFQRSGGTLFDNYINSTSILIVSWAISQMRYRRQIEYFNTRRLIQEKNDELKRLNNELQRANQELAKLSQTDSLTGIFNRSVFDSNIRTEWDRCKRHFIPLSLIMIDIDFFKAYNDNYGHQAGDDCLRQIAGELSDCARRSDDTTARYGGEEFAVILPYMGEEGSLKVAEQMRRKVEELKIPHEYSPISKYVTISLGVCTVIPSGKPSVEEFIRGADRALYEAKKGNRNNVVVA